jgi:hypothetical protein
MAQANARPRYPITPRRLSMKAVVAGVISAVLLAVLCISGLVLSMSGGKDGKPAAAPAAPDTHTSQGGAAPSGNAKTSAAPKQDAPKQDPPKQDQPSNIATMPDVVGMNAALAEDRLDKLGLKNLKFASGDKRYQFVLVVQNWTVTKQSTPAGTKVDKSTLIVLTCVKP